MMMTNKVRSVVRRLGYKRDFELPVLKGWKRTASSSNSSSVSPKSFATSSPLKQIAAEWQSMRRPFTTRNAASVSTRDNELRNAARIEVKLSAEESKEMLLQPRNPKVEKIVRSSARRIMSLFEDYGNSMYTIGEPMTITEHSVQTAFAARDSGENVEAQLSCLLHDVGHLCGLESHQEPGMDGCGTEDHERIGAEFLGSLGFSDTVSYLALHHVNAKRYLCARNKEYMDSLTPASKTTLAHQGGPMTEEECKEVEKDSRWPLVLRMRSYDEAGKSPGRDAAELVRSYKNAIVNNLRESVTRQIEGKDDHMFPLCEFAGSYVLSEEQLDSYDKNGFLIIRNVFAKEQIEALPGMAKELAEMTKETCGDRLIHFERAHDGEKRVCRVENFVKPCEKWSSESYLGMIENIVSQAYGEPAVLFKDKVNFKGPKCGGFLPHQDATAYVTDNLASHHISVLVAVDHASPHTGALEIAPGRHKEGVFENEAGVIAESVNKDMKYEMVNVKPGDIVLFDSYLPHRSGRNESSTEWRRAGYLTFNKLSEGDLHASYYDAKAAAVKEGTAGSISVNKDFGGNVIE